MSKLWLVASLSIVFAASAEEVLPVQQCAKLAEELEAHLQKHIVAPWYPAAVDKAGGFQQDFAEDWTPRPGGNKTIVYQSRLTWMAAAMALAVPSRADEFKPYALHGLEFLAKKMWDEKHGGFYWGVNADGSPLADDGGEKHVYGISFGMYAASTVYKATRDPAALELAQRTFRWLEDHAYDQGHSGYHEALTAEGVPILTPTVEHPNDRIGTRYGFKSMNTHIHMLESLTELYDVWPDNAVLLRLEQLHGIVRDRIVTSPGCMHLYFNDDWTPVPDLDSYGHDIETAYLLMEACAALKRPDDVPTWKRSREIVTNALTFGWDEKNGGFFDEGSAFRKVWIDDKVWWVQAEGLNALLLMHEKFGKEDPRFGAAFVKQWEFIRNFQTDNVHNGWISKVSRDGKAEAGQAKSDQWKDPYHQGRAVMNVIERLKRLAR